MLTPEHIDAAILMAIKTPSLTPKNELLALCRTIEKAARREAMDYVAQWLEMSDAPLSRKAAADAIRALMGEER